MKKIFELFYTFFKIGAFTFGGGLAMIPLIHTEMVEKKKWITDDEMVNMIAIAESTPGVIAVNSATYVGYKVGGILGSFFATLGVILPSIVIITIIATFYKQFLAIKAVEYAFYGIRAGVVVLIFNALLKLFKNCPKTAISYILILFSIALSLIFNLSAIYIILIGAFLGITLQIMFVRLNLVKEIDKK